MLAEGVLHFFQWRTHEAYDRIRRAYGLAVALETGSAIPSCAAWMAHIEFNEGAYDKMVSHLQQSLAAVTTDDHQARARASLVIADSYHLAGEYGLARPWYEQTRQSATAEGDEATLSAMLYNVAAFRASNVRLADCFGNEKGSEAHRASMETNSSASFDYAIGTEGLEFLTPMLRGLILTIGQKFPEALMVYGGLKDDQLPKRTLSPIYADRAWCSANIGSNDMAWLFAMRAIDEIQALSEADDVAYVEARVAQVAKLLGRHDEASHHQNNALDSLAKHKLFQSELLKKLQAIK